MKILIITYTYTPDLTPRAFRWSAIAKYMADRGHQVDIICRAMKSAVEVNNGESSVVIHRVHDWNLHVSNHMMYGASKINPLDSNNLNYSRPSLIKKSLRIIWQAFRWPDSACGWIVPAVYKAKYLCKENNYDWIISSSHPFTGHVVGLLTRIISPKCRWLVDISDPFFDMKESAPNNRRLYAAINRAVEARIIDSSDVISVTTEATQILYQTTFPGSTGKIRVIPPMLSLPETSLVLREKNDKIIRLTFIGTLYKQLRSPKYLLRCFSELSKEISERRIELHFYGNFNDCGEYFAEENKDIKLNIFHHGLVSRELVVQAMARSDILVNIGNNSKELLASKVVEYMAMGKPILNIISNREDMSIRILADYPAKLTVEGSGDHPSNEVIKLIKNFVLFPKSVDEKVIAYIRNKYSIKEISSIYENILESR